ncbi:uncharacterized protein METZ01_LOCUS443727, partial [marine metagenome]
TISSILARHRLALQLPVPTRIFRLRASNDKAPSAIAAKIVPPLMLRQMHTFLKLLIIFFSEVKIVLVV